MNKLTQEEIDTIVRGFKIVRKICDTHVCDECPMYFKPTGSTFIQCMCTYSPNLDFERLARHLEEWSEDDA